MYGGRLRRAVLVVHERLEISADDLLLARLAAHVVVHDAIARHVHPHVRGRVIDEFRARDLGEDAPHHGEDLDVAVVVDRHLAVCFQVEIVHLVDIFEVRRRRLVGDVDGMPEGKVPDGEGLELGVSRLHSPLELVIELAEAGGKFAAAGTGRRRDDEGTGGLDVRIGAIALVRDDGVDLVRIALGGTVQIDLDAAIFQLVFVRKRRLLIAEHSDDHAVDVDAHARDVVDHALHFAAVGDAVVGAHLVLLDVARIDADD